VLKRAIFHDESVYPNAHVFNPDRFLKDGQINPEVKDPEELAFGYGRRYLHLRWTSVLRSSDNTRDFYRVCPGKHFAIRVLFLAIAHTLAVFDISKCLDGDGKPIVPDGGYTFGFVS